MIKVTKLSTKPSNDKCDYYTFELPNKLNVFIVEDPETDEACGTMLVKIGYGHDTITGIAHFLEHMLFNGTEKYPDENEYSKYISKNGGSQNAYTAHDHTCYFFTVQPECIEQSLDMFGNFFVCPLLNPDSVDREKNAVNSEHIKNITNDSWRLQEVMRHAMVKENSLSNFGTGSSKTLDIPDIAQHVRHFFEKFYSSHLMTLFVVAKKNTPSLTQKIVDIFSQVPHRVTYENMKYIGTKIYDYPKTLQVVPLKEMEKLVISWDLPSYKHCPLRSPYHFLSHIIGHEGKNTIHYLLSQLGLITSLSAGIEINCNDRCTFSVTIMMTPIGASYKNDILFTVTQYIELMKTKINFDHMEELYNEQMTLDAFDFKFSTKQNPMDKTMQYARLVVNNDFELSDMLMIPYAKENFNPNVKSYLFNVLNEMTIEKSVVMFASNSYTDLTSLVDPDYGTCYNISDSYVSLNGATINVSLLDLPNINNFISLGETIISLNETIPKRLNYLNNKLIVYHLPTNKFEIPSVSVKVCVSLPVSIQSAENYVKTTLYFTSLLGEINNELYMCNTAEYRINVLYVSGKLYINAYGNYLKIKKVCEFLVNSLMNKTLITEKIYNTAVYGITMSAKNSVMLPPHRRINNFFEKRLCSKYYNNYDIMRVLDSGIVNIESVKDMIDELLHVSNVTMLISGNSTESLAYEICQVFEKFVSSEHSQIDEVMHNEFFDIYSHPADGVEIMVENVENKLETNSAVTYDVFIEKIKIGHTNNWAKISCLLNILDSLISTDYFDEVRTKDAYGYIVGSSRKTHGYVPESKYYRFIVQSPHKTSREIITRTEKFIIDYAKKLASLGEEELSEVISAIVSSLEAPYNNLEEMAEFIFESEILSNLLTFDLKKQLLAELQTIRTPDLLHFYNDKFMQNKKVLVIGLEGNK